MSLSTKLQDALAKDIPIIQTEVLTGEILCFLCKRVLSTSGLYGVFICVPPSRLTDVHTFTGLRGAAAISKAAYGTDLVLLAVRPSGSCDIAGVVCPKCEEAHIQQLAEAYKGIPYVHASLTSRWQAPIETPKLVHNEISIPGLI
jgi:hypothetical protein